MLVAAEMTVMVPEMLAALEMAAMAPGTVQLSNLCME
jgi:hypothetical protein